ncbi:hypothetical protein [Myxococcus xanthus]|uniref:Uncharacterized protein n=1 Tax=Myxococcus xanthus TaxID=34 RepID=A0A7Y4IJB7_MYXXA|nr:hypothetical protein [Myxococcus xanthus]NOJ79645.1 hypothetical protein [Myxococcus xanthus]NOJ85933.1 hypothetical protein [Myxococcus xanthus]
MKSEDIHNSTSDSTFSRASTELSGENAEAKPRGSDALTQPWSPRTSTDEKPVPSARPSHRPLGEHKYTYDLTGEDAPLQVRFADGPVNDNSGLVRILVLPGA